MDCSLPCSSVHRIAQARILEWVTISFSRGSSRPRDRTWVSCLAGRFFTIEPPGKPLTMLNDYIIIIWSPMTVFLHFCVFLLLWLNLFFGQSFYTPKKGRTWWRPAGGRRVERTMGTCSTLVLLGEFSSVQSLSCVRLFATPWTAAHQVSLSITNSWSLLKLMSIESVMPPHPLSFLLLPPSFFPSIRVFSNESALWIRWSEYWSFSFSISPSN